MLVVVLFVLVVFLLYAPLHRAHSKIREEVTKREALLNDQEFRNTVRNRRYVPLHTLPTVRWHSNFDTVEGSSSCFSVPTLVTTYDTGNFDCAAVCSDDRAVYFYVAPNDVFVVNGSVLRSGGYCSLNSIPRNCNRETSVILYSVNQWTCIADDPRYFAGEANLMQVAGRQHSDMILPTHADRNVLWDNRFDREVNPLSNTFRYSWDDTMEDGRRRFEVRCNALDIHHNKMILNPLNEIECMPNVCTNVHWVHPDVRPNFATGICDCGNRNTTRVENIDASDRSSRCAAVTNRVVASDRDYNFRVECLSLDTPVTEYRKHKLLCPPDIFNQNTDFAYTFTLNGVVPLSRNGIDEPTTRLWRDTRGRVAWNMVR